MKREELDDIASQVDAMYDTKGQSATDAAAAGALSGGAAAPSAAPSGAGASAPSGGASAGAAGAPAAAAGSSSSSSSAPAKGGAKPPSAMSRRLVGGPVARGDAEVQKTAAREAERRLRQGVEREETKGHFPGNPLKVGRIERRGNSVPDGRTT